VFVSIWRRVRRHCTIRGGKGPIFSVRGVETIFSLMNPKQRKNSRDSLVRFKGVAKPVINFTKHVALPNYR